MLTTNCYKRKKKKENWFCICHYISSSRYSFMKPNARNSDGHSGSGIDIKNGMWPYIYEEHHYYFSLFFCFTCRFRWLCSYAQHCLNFDSPVGPFQVYGSLLVPKHEQLFIYLECVFQLLQVMWHMMIWKDHLISSKHISNRKKHDHSVVAIRKSKNGGYPRMTSNLL